LPAGAGCETCERMLLLLVFMRDNNMVSNLQRCTSSYDSKCFAACDCWTAECRSWPV